ncbi:MAG: hypothetical protein LBT48_00010 [Prevotellaceae bacterium]|jgi:hypothetical protein|nr:hypothetical protein [Prevotellaceae bacterium]
MKNNRVRISFVFLLYFVAIACYADDKIKEFMLKNNMEYPFNITVNINASSYVLSEYGEQALTHEQKELLEHFVGLLRSDIKYYKELKKHTSSEAMTINSVKIFNNGIEEYIMVGIEVYTNTKHGDMSKYDAKNEIWRTSILTLYSTRNLKFKYRIF